MSSKYYGYEDKQLQLTGLARYDGLKDKNQKLILITPTWRKEVAVKYVFGEKRGYNPQFKDSAYYHIYNTLINDPRLLETAKRTGYRIMYLLHPATSSQLPDFKYNGYVELVAATGDMSYEKVLTEASLMVTDYSGVQFDPEKVDLYFESKAGKIKIIENGVSTGYSEEEATKILSEEAVTAIADMKMGDASATAWGCDLTYDYIKINADYRS